MNLVFVIELGHIPSGGSKKGQFFGTFLDENPRWQFAMDYRDLVHDLDDEYRTREFHHGSVIRKQLLAGGRVDINHDDSKSGPLESMMWRNATSIVSGGAVVVRTVLSASEPLDPQGTQAR